MIDSVRQVEEKFLDTIYYCFLTQFINRSTFGVDWEGGYVLELDLLSEPERFLDLDYEPHLGTVSIEHALLEWSFGFG